MGIPVKAQLTGFNIIVERLSDHENLDMWMLGWGLSLYPDYLEAFFHSSNAGEDGLNVGGYSNPEFDALADALLEETDLEEARKQVFQMQEFPGGRPALRGAVHHALAGSLPLGPAGVPLHPGAGRDSGPGRDDHNCDAQVA